jgi:GT2 family glycosyltransferase
MSVDREWGPQLCFTVPDEKGDYRFPPMAAGKIPHKGLLEVGHAGTGAMLIRRDVFEAFSMEGDDVPFFVPHEARLNGMKTGTILIGEDIAFCNQLRAKGIPVHVDLEAHVGHRKTLALAWEDKLRDPALDAATWKLPAGCGKQIVSR